MTGSTKPLLTVLLGALVAGGCAPLQTGSDSLARENRDLRSMLKQTMRELRQVELEQEKLRAQVEQLEYRQKLLSERAGIDPSVVASGVRSSEPSYGQPFPGQEPPVRLGSAAPSTGLEELMAAASAQGGGGSAAVPPTIPGAPPPGGTDLGSADPSRVRGRVVGPIPVDDGLSNAPARSSPSADSATRPAFGTRPGGTGARPYGSTSEAASGARGRGPDALTAEDELEMPEVPGALRSTSFATAARAMADAEYAQAVQGFRDFIHDNSTSPYADDAQYWIGESYRRQGAYSKAIIEFNQVVVHYRTGNRSAKALLKQAEVFSLLGDEVDARLSLQKVINNYPGSPEAERAARLLAGSAETTSAVR